MVNAAGVPLFGLAWSASTGEVFSMGADGAASTTGQRLIPDADYDLQIEFDNKLHVWSAALNGERIIRDLSWPSTSALPVALGAHWTPGNEGPNATITIGEQVTKVLQP